MKLLIIEDERQLSESIVKFLSNEDYLCEQAFSYAEAEDKISVYEYDCILLDITLPDGTGLDLLKKNTHFSTSNRNYYHFGKRFN